MCSRAGAAVTVQQGGLTAGVTLAKAAMLKQMLPMRTPAAVYQETKEEEESQYAQQRQIQSKFARHGQHLARRPMQP